MTSRRPTLRLRKLVSGGQTGVDRGALDAAIQLGIEHGGWCPRGRRAEDGVIPDRYQLVETPAWEYKVRTEKNVVDSDGTLILFRGELTGGTRLTYRLVRERGKPFWLVDLSDHPDVEDTLGWLEKHAIEVLNVAGPRESSAPGITAETEAFVRHLCQPIAPRRERRRSRQA